MKKKLPLELKKKEDGVIYVKFLVGNGIADFGNAVCPNDMRSITELPIGEEIVEPTMLYAKYVIPTEAQYTVEEMKEAKKYFDKGLTKWLPGNNWELQDGYNTGFSDADIFEARETLSHEGIRNTVWLIGYWLGFEGGLAKRRDEGRMRK